MKVYILLTLYIHMELLFLYGIYKYISSTINFTAFKLKIKKKIERKNFETKKLVKIQITQVFERDKKRIKKKIKNKSRKLEW